MGVGLRFVSSAASTPPKEMKFLDDQMLDDLNVRWVPNEFEPWSVEPSGAGVIAITRSKDKTQTATFSCFNDGIPRLTVRPNLSGHASLDWFKDAVKLVESVAAFDLTFPKDSLTLKSVNGGVALEFALKGVNGSVIAASKHSIIGVDGPRFIMGAMSYKIPKENAKAAINVALMNCV
jgi:hypothetical protein